MFVFQTKKCTCANILRDVDFIPMDAFHKMFVVRANFYPKKKYLVVVFSCFSQKHKVRLIDDFTQSGVNHFVTAHEEPSLHTVDIADSTITVWMSCLMNMINFYLLKGQSEFLHVKQKQLPCSKCPCAFWLIAGQVTQQYK